MLGAEILKKVRETENTPDTERNEFLQKEASQYVYHDQEIDYEHLKQIHLILVNHTRRIRSLLSCILLVPGMSCTLEEVPLPSDS